MFTFIEVLLMLIVGYCLIFTVGIVGILLDSIFTVGMVGRLLDALATKWKGLDKSK